MVPHGSAQRARRRDDPRRGDAGAVMVPHGGDAETPVLTSRSGMRHTYGDGAAPEWRSDYPAVHHP